MRKKLFYFSAIIALNAHSFFTMPDWQADTWSRLGKMALRDFSGIEPYSFTVFVLFGMFSLLLAALILTDGWYQRLPAWPFALSMMALGPSMVFVYQAFRRDNEKPHRPQNSLEELARSKGLPIVIGLVSLGALWDGRGGRFEQLWVLFQTDYLTHAMLVDETLFILLTPILVAQDCRRRQRSMAWAWFSLLPIFGACAYLITAKKEVPNTV
jgi:hypothetical protein